MLKRKYSTASRRLLVYQIDFANVAPFRPAAVGRMNLSDHADCVFDKTVWPLSRLGIGSSSAPPKAGTKSFIFTVGSAAESSPSTIRSGPLPGRHQPSPNSKSPQTPLRAARGQVPEHLTRHWPHLWDAVLGRNERFATSTTESRASRVRFRLVRFSKTGLPSSGPSIFLLQEALSLTLIATRAGPKNRF
jgi:hypothetical protein